MRPTPPAEQRIVDAVSELAARDGYASLTVERVLVAARVSRATFYQHFTSVEDCFLCAYRTHAQQLLQRIDAAPGDDRELAVLDTLIELAMDRPAVALLLAREGLAAGRAALREREVLIRALGDALTRASSARRAVDLPPAIFLGGVFRFLAMQLSAGSFTAELVDDLHRWRSALTRTRLLPWNDELVRAIATTADEPRRPVPVKRSQPTRERLLRATAAAIYSKGYGAATVGDIVALAGVSRQRFYDHFASKRDAFIATYESAFAQTVSAGTPAFFKSLSWPERVWESSYAFIGFFAAEPTLAHLGLVECYALGTEFLDRVLETQGAFTLFLEEGYRQGADTEKLPRSFSSLIATSIFEIGFLASLSGAGLHMRRLHPLVVYIALAPFLGVDAAESFVRRKLSAA